MAAISAFGNLVSVGMVATKGVKAAQLCNIIKKLGYAAKIAENAGEIGLNVTNMYVDYAIKEKEFSIDTVASGLALGLNVFGIYASAKRYGKFCSETADVGKETDGIEGGNKVVEKVEGVSGEAHNVVNYAKLKEQYRVNELANDVIESIKQTGVLPDNYITKSQAKAMGWSEGKALNNYAPGKALGGDIFANTNGLLPNENGRIWYEADIGVDYTMSRSNSKNPAYRILYSNDGLIYGTYDHYDTVFQIKP